MEYKVYTAVHVADIFSRGYAYMTEDENARIRKAKFKRIAPYYVSERNIYRFPQLKKEL